MIGFEKIESMTEYVDELEGFVDQANQSIKDLVKRSIEKLQGKK